MELKTFYVNVAWRAGTTKGYPGRACKQYVYV